LNGNAMAASNKENKEQNEFEPFPARYTECLVARSVFVLFLRHTTPQEAKTHGRNFKLFW